MTLYLVIALVFILLLMRVPVAVSLILPCLIYLGLLDGVGVGQGLQAATTFLNSFALLAVPLFILVGFVAHEAGLAARLVDALLLLCGRRRGSMAYVDVAGSFVFSWMSGSATADAAAMGKVMLPAMKANGYSGSFAAGLTGAAALMGPVMPPSIAAVLFAVLASSSVGGVLAAGVVPAALMFAALMVYVFVRTRKETTEQGVAVARSISTARILLDAVPMLATPFVLLGGILSGIFTPTEAAAVASGYLILASLALRWLDLGGLYRALVGAAATTGQVMLIAAAGGVFAYVLVREQGAQLAAETVLAFTSSSLVFLLILNVVLLLAGTIIEPASGLLILVPVVLPIATEFGIDPLHLGVIMIINLNIGLLTPPVGLVLYVMSSIGEMPVSDVVRGTLPTLIPLVGVLLLVTYVPVVALWLPRTLGF